MALSTGQYDGIRGIKEAKNSHRQSCHSTVEYDISFVCNKHVPGRGGGSSKAHEEVKKSKAMTYVSKNPLDFPVQESRLEANVMNKLFPRILPLLIAFTVAVRLAPAAHAQTTTPAEQAVLHGYQKAPQPISDILSAAPTPLVLVSPKANQLLVVDRLANPPVADLAQPMLRLAGLRINPATNGRHHPPRFVGLSVVDFSTGKTRTVTGLPATPYMPAPEPSPPG